MTKHPLFKHISVNFASGPRSQNTLIVAYFHSLKLYFGIFTWFGMTDDSINNNSAKFISRITGDTGVLQTMLIALGFIVSPHMVYNFLLLADVAFGSALFLHFNKYFAYIKEAGLPPFLNISRTKFDCYLYIYCQYNNNTIIDSILLYNI